MAKAKEKTDDELLAEMEAEEAAAKAAAAKAEAEKAAAEKAESEPVPDPEPVDYDEPATFDPERPEWRGVIAELDGKPDELHSLQVRFSEMRPVLAGAIAKAEGELKRFLQSLAEYL